MKKLLLLTMMLGMFMLAGAQSPSPSAPVADETITVKKSDLTTDQLVKINTEAATKLLQTKLERYGNWVGVGGEIGTAIKEGLNAVVDVADKFGNTRVGTFTMILVAWKVVGKDLVRIIIGFLFMIIVTVFIFRNYRNMNKRRICTKGRGWKFWLPKEYTIVEPRFYEGIELVKFIHIIALVGSFGITYAIMFG